MSGVRVLVGTHKGAFILTSTEKRKRWKISGPLFAGPLERLSGVEAQIVNEACMRRDLGCGNSADSDDHVNEE